MSKAITRIYKGPIRKLMVTEAIKKTDGTFSLKIPEPEQAEIIKNDAEFYSVILPDNVKKEIKAGSRLHIVGNLKTEFNKFKLNKDVRNDVKLI